MMKKRLMAGFIALLMGLGTILTGCTSTLRPALEKRKTSTSNLSELDLSLLYTEETGFGFPGISWGEKLRDIEEITDRTMSGVSGIGDNYVIYKAEGAKFLLQGRCNDETDVLIVNDVAVRVSAVYTKTSDYASKEVTMSEFFEKELNALQALFGEQTEKVERSSVVNNINVKSVTYTWKKPDKNGVETQLQWACAYTGDEEEPSYVTFGVLYLSDEVKEALKGDSEE